MMNNLELTTKPSRQECIGIVTSFLREIKFLEKRKWDCDERLRENRVNSLDEFKLHAAVVHGLEFYEELENVDIEKKRVMEADLTSEEASEEKNEDEESQK